MFGPVPSRRFGLSLGVDLVPYKTCTYDCIYCQLGKTTNLTLKRESFFDVKVVIEELEEVVKSGVDFDFITISGSGEPTLCADIGKVIFEIKSRFEKPLVLLTNGSLLFEKDLRRELLSVDICSPSLDAGCEKDFKIINRPHNHLNFQTVLEGIIKFSKEFSGELFLEVMVLDGINDGYESLSLIKGWIDKISPKKVHLNTVARPPAEDMAKPLKKEELFRIKKFFGSNCEIIEYKMKKASSHSLNLEDDILKSLARRPQTLKDLSVALGVNPNEVSKYINFLLEEGKLKKKVFEKTTYYSVS